MNHERLKPPIRACTPDLIVLGGKIVITRVGQCDRGVNKSFCIGDAFVAKFARAGQKLVYSTYLGGAGYDSAATLVLDDRGEAYIAGQTGSRDFPIRNPYQGSLSGPTDSFVSKLNAAGSGLVFSTFLGGSSFDGATGIALDRRSNIYVTGITGSTDFPLVRPFQSVNKGGPADGFITKLNPQASQLIYSTYVGGSGFDYPFRIAVNRHEDAALIGFTSSTDLPYLPRSVSLLPGGCNRCLRVSARQERTAVSLFDLSRRYRR